MKIKLPKRPNIQTAIDNRVVSAYTKRKTSKQGRVKKCALIAVLASP